ncbi:hypothetical protein CQW23_04374 [Capsicum baccatum]|uniref:O-methyltransferase C-terminal domain-containing protein n=1 Tax=Capsicum baccatum TaxID=33114 RepID=A0A2G2XEG9_CAPBA|nr:hypothetical protein CQW23_04374 [Capsicum baccatum]
MESSDVPMASDMFRAQAHIYKHAFSFANPMVLSCAIQLGIPDVIYSHKQPMTLTELVSELKLTHAKSNGINRLMRLLVYSGFFATTKFLDENLENQEGYVLTASSKLLLKRNETTPFETAHGSPMWEFCDQNPRFNNVFNEAMANDSQMMCLVVKDCKQVFQEMDSMADVGGGTGLIAKTILAAFPHLKCTVLDLPHVVANMPDTENLKYVGGDMFQSIPSADAILFKVTEF